MLFNAYVIINYIQAIDNFILGLFANIIDLFLNHLQGRYLVCYQQTNHIYF